MRRSFPHAALAVSLFACGGNAANLHGRTARAGDATDSPYAHIEMPVEDGDDTVPPALALPPVSGSERAAVARPDADSSASTDSEVPEIVPSDTPESLD